MSIFHKAARLTAAHLRFVLPLAGILLVLAAAAVVVGSAVS